MMTAVCGCSRCSSSGEPQAVVARHHHVDDGQVVVLRRAATASASSAFDAVVRPQAQRRDPPRHQIAHGRLVVDDQNGGHGVIGADGAARGLPELHTANPRECAAVDMCAHVCYYAHGRTLMTAVSAHCVRSERAIRTRRRPESRTGTLLGPRAPDAIS